MLVDMADDIDGDGTDDANVIGAADQSNGQPTPTFGSDLGTFMGIAGSYTAVRVSGNFVIMAVTPANYLSSDGTISSAYSNLHSLQVIGMYIGGPTDSTHAVDFANIVMPTGTVFTASGYLTGNDGDAEFLSVTNG